MKKHMLWIVPVLLISSFSSFAEEATYKIDPHLGVRGNDYTRPGLSVGKLDAVYPDESRIIIDDTNFALTRESRLIGEGGSFVSIDSLDPGKMVRFEYQRNPGGMNLLRTLQVISEDEAKAFFAHDEERE